MTSTLKTAGIDGCKAGWLAISLDRGHASYNLLRTSEELRDYLTENDCTFIDVPIGLCEDKPVRMCDFLLRRVLGSSYSSSVFGPPVRAAFLVNDYKTACDINEAKAGKRFSKQAWNIMPKIRQVDDILQENASLVSSVHESHPELLFKKLNRGGEALPKKRTDEGFERRFTLLKRADKRIEHLYTGIRTEFLKKEVKDDDILDAFILAIMSAQTPHRPIRTLPLPPEIDGKGIPMAIHFV